MVTFHVDHTMEEQVNEASPTTVPLRKKNINKYLAAVALVVLAGGVIWTADISTQKSNVKSLADTSLTPSLNPTEAIIDVNPTGIVKGKTRREFSGKLGSVTIKEIRGKTWVNVNISVSEGIEWEVEGGQELKNKKKKEEQEKNYGLTINQGNCSHPGVVKYTLATLDDGGSETFLPVTLNDFKLQLPVSIVAHKSETDTTVVSCADITALN
jgi:hypothetical protein